MNQKIMTIESGGLVEDRFEVPEDAIPSLLAYMQRHQNLTPFAVSAGIFLRHWRMGVNLILQPIPKPPTQ